MEITPIKTKEIYLKALSRFEEIFDATPGSIESDEADILGALLEIYEAKNYPIEAPDPIEAIKIRMEELHLRQQDLVGDLGGKNRVSEILNRKRKLNVDMIRKLSLKLSISPNILIKEYLLST